MSKAPAPTLADAVEAAALVARFEGLAPLEMDLLGLLKLGDHQVGPTPEGIRELGGRYHLARRLAETAARSAHAGPGHALPALRRACALLDLLESELLRDEPAVRPAARPQHAGVTP